MSRILIYSDRGGVYGAEQINHCLALSLQSNGHEVTVVQPEAHHHLIATQSGRGITHHWLTEENVYDLRTTAPSLVDPSDAKRIFAAAKPDVVLFADSFPCANLAAKQVAARQNIPYIVLLHCVQAGWATDYADYVPLLPATYEAALEVVAVSGENLTLLHEHFGLAPDLGRVIHYGRPAEFFADRRQQVRQRVREALRIAHDSVVFLTVGRFEFAKGYHYLLDALPRLRQSPSWEQSEFVWVGAGTLEQQIRKVATFLGSGRVHVLSERDDVTDLLDCADVLLHPAQFEGMPLVVLEAMAKSLPIIATPVSGIPEALGETGVLLPAPQRGPQFSERIATEVARLANDPARRERVGLAAHRRAEQMYTEQRMCADWNQLVNRMLTEAL